jgi:hypothetical protein
MATMESLGGIISATDIPIAEHISFTLHPLPLWQ